MTDKIFISISELKSSTDIEANVDDLRLKSSILKAQNLHLQELIGSTWFDSLDSKRTDEGTWSGLTLAEEVLIDKYMNYVIQQYAVYEFLKRGNFSITNQGIERQSASNSQSAEMNEIEFLYRDQKDDADFYAQRMRKYICDNLSDFPLYVEGNQNLPPQRGNYGIDNIMPA